MSVYKNRYARERARQAAIAAKETRRRVAPLLDNLAPSCASRHYFFSVGGYLTCTIRSATHTGRHRSGDAWWTCDAVGPHDGTAPYACDAVLEV